MQRIDEPISYRYRAKKLVAVFFLGVVGCNHNPPFQEYSLARVSLEAAKRARASRHSPIFFTKAQESYAAGELQFKKENYSDSKTYFEIAREYSEKAEDQSRVKKWKMGDAD